jgi:pSer/pThr/pTyr-binding forkhead associated (FHA) protein
MSEQPPKPKKTDYLNLPTGSEMADRASSAYTKPFTDESRLQFQIENQKFTITVIEEVLIGRSVEGDEQHRVDLDLTPQGGYQNGVSRRHARISKQDGALYIADLGSTNGTRINGSQLTPSREYRLRDGDEVEFARVRTIVRFLGTDDAG